MPGSTVTRSFAVPAGAMPHLDSSQPMNLVRQLRGPVDRNGEPVQSGRK